MKITWKRIITLFLAISIGVLPLCACSPDEPQPTPDPEPDPTPDPEPDPEPEPEPEPEPDPEPEPEPWLSEITTAPIKATRVLLANAPGGADGVTMGTLQGLAAKLSDTQILLRANSWTTYFPFMQAMGVKSSDKNEAGQAWDLSTLLAYYAPKLSGYILSSAESINVAISLSGVTNAVVVQPENEQKAKDAGLTMLLDVTDKDDTWLRKSEYFAKISRSVAVEQPASMAPKLVDYAVMAGAYFNFYDGKEGSEHTAMFDFLDDGAIVVGWNNTLGEYHTVKSLAGINACLIPADHAYNLSTLSSVAGEGKLNVERYAQEDADEPHVEDTAVHTVCIVMSDGDNLQWNLNDYTTSNKWYGSPLRGSFPMNWGVPALLGDLALPMMNYFSKTQSEEDEIIMQLSGLGYTFPSLWEADARANMAARVASSMEARGMKFMNILDDHGFNNETMDAFTWQDGIEGIFYTDYSNYAGYEGQILWSNDKPVVSARYRLWNGIAGCDPLKIARSINNAPANIYNEEAYSFIIVHAWSGLNGEGKLVPNGDTMAAVQELISLLDVDVEIVSASEFMARIKDNLAP